MGGEIFKWCQPAHHQLWSKQRPRFIPHGTDKTNDKSHFPGRKVSTCINDVVITSVHSEKTHLKKLMMTIMIIITIIIMYSLQETTIFSGRQKRTVVMKLRAEK